MTIEFLFCINKKPYAVLSWIIALATGRLISHVGIRIMRKGSDVVYHAKFPRTLKQSYIEFKHEYHITERYCFPVDHEQTQEKMIKWLDAKVGTKFSLKQLILNGVNLISEPLARKLGKSFWNGDRKLICIELVARFLALFFGVTWQESYDTVDLNDGREIIRRLKGV